MSLSLEHLQSAPRRRRRRLGRGHGSGRGTTAGRGTKGQRARTGSRSGLRSRALRQFYLHIQKRGGFRGPSEKAAVVGLGDLERNFAAGATVNPAILAKKGMVPSGTTVKILRNGTIGHAVQVSGCSVSAAARADIERVGGTVAD